MMFSLLVVLCFNLALLGSATSPSLSPSLAPSPGPTTARSSMNNVKTVAGTGVEGNTGVGGPATAATFNFPWGLWENSVGVLYVGGQYNGCVRKFSTTGSSVMSAAVGLCGDNSFSGDGGPATSARISVVTGLAGATTGVLYVGEQGNNRVRIVSSAGIISTYAGSSLSSISGDGGPASAAGVPAVNGLFLDSTGVLYIVMLYSGSVRSVNTLGIISQYAGTYVAGYNVDSGPATSVQFSTFTRIFGDTTGVMYLGDSSNFIVRKISSSGIVSLLGGTFYTVYEGRENIAFTSFSVGQVRDVTVDPNNGDIYVSSTGTYRIFVTTRSTGLTSTFAGTGSPTSAGDGGAATSASFNYNDGIFRDTNGQVYVGEMVGNKVRAIYTVSPSTAPTPAPTTLKPTHLPTTFSPSLQPLPIRSSPSFKVENAFSFAGLTSSGGVMTWGASTSGGDSSSVSSRLFNVVEVVSSKNAFAALKSDGSVVAWGEASSIAGWNTSMNLMSLVATERAFAGVTGDGGVVAFGANCCGGNVDEYGFAQYLTSGVRSITASAGAFCALKAVGTVYCWGNEFAGGGVSSVTRTDLSGIVLLVATRSAFAGMTSDGSVVSWGNKYFGGVMPSSVSSALSQHTKHILSSEMAFVAYTDTKMLISWSQSDLGGGADLSEPGGVTFVAHTSRSFAAIRTNHSLVSWGDSDAGGDSSFVATQLATVTTVVGNDLAFAALTSAGRVVAWGADSHGGYVSTSLKNISSVYHTSRAFAALHNGTVLTWGSSYYGGSVDNSVYSYVQSKVKLICSNDVSFTAVRRDGTAVMWGSSAITRVSGMVLSGNYSKVISC